MKKRRLWKKALLIILFVVLVVESFGAFSMAQSYLEVKGKKNNEEKVNNFKGQKAEDKNDINVLLIGTDSRGEDRGRSDSLMIAHYDQKSKTPKLVSIMRDTYVEIPGYGKEKINAAYSLGGVELVRKTISANFHVPIEYYVVVNFNDFKDIINTLFPSGLEINAEKDMNLDGVDIKKGLQKMDGNTTLQYARFRHDEESDFGRVRRQQQVLSAIAAQSANLESITRLPKTIGKLLGYVSTNLPTTTLISCAKDFLLGDTKEVKTLSIPIQASWEFKDYENVGSVLEVDFTKNSEALKKFLTE